MRIFFEKSDFTIALAVILIFASYIFLPFFIFTPLVQISMDSFTYSYLAKLIFDGNIPALELITDLPVGYPLIISLTRFLKLSFNQLVVFQLVFYMISFVFLCFQLSRFTKFGGVVAMITFIFYSLNSHTIKHVFTVNPESFYTSTLILLVGGLFYYLRSKTKSSLVIIFLCITAASLLRSNGVYLFFIVLFIFYEILKTKDNLRFYFISCLACLLLISSFNYTIKGEFAPFDKKRISKVLTVLSNDISSVELDSLKKETKTQPPRKTMFFHYFTSFFKRHTSYYYSMQKTNFKRISKNKTFSNLDQKFFDGALSVRNSDLNLLTFMFQDKNYHPKILRNIDFRSGKENIWLYSLYVIQEIIYYLKINFIFLFLFLGYLIYHISLIFYKKKLNRQFIIFSIHLVSFLILPFIHGRFVYRYIQVSEFIIYIGALLFIMSLFYRKKLKKSD